MVFGAVVIWNGAITTAYALWAQTRGQAFVAPSEVGAPDAGMDFAVRDTSLTRIRMMVKPSSTSNLILMNVSFTPCSQANLMYSTQPLWSTLFAAILLKVCILSPVVVTLVITRKFRYCSVTSFKDTRIRIDEVGCFRSDDAISWARDSNKRRVQENVAQRLRLRCHALGRRLSAPQECYGQRMADGNGTI